MILLLNFSVGKSNLCDHVDEEDDVVCWALIETARGGSDESSQAQPMFSQGSQVKRIDDGVDQCGDDYNEEYMMMMALKAH